MAKGDTADQAHEDRYAEEQGRAGEESTATAERTPPPVDIAEPPFTREEFSQLEAEDSHAGSVIGKMLALFFLYTVIVMIVVAIWTFSVLI